MKNRLRILTTILLAGVTRIVVAGQVPQLAESPDIPISPHDRVYTGDQTSNTVSVYDPSSNQLLGVLRLGDVTPQNLSPLYRGLTLKDVRETQVFDADPPFALRATLETGPITNHVNFVRNKNGQFAYVTVGGENVVKVFTLPPQNRPPR